MLQIKNIYKTYKTGDLVQQALKGVSLNLRDNEFVAILGPSGSGKTTLLNIIGGLDRYDDGDLIINNVSTKKYKDRDWDAYRNHTIGFVFQSYNLIPHQTILSNVELALTISGVSSKERKQRALEALDKVGLKDQAHKKPNQMSGGQMQRVAIARALVNNPDILLADEPTGALDTKTSIQVMDLLKEVAKDKLVVMVTHNPELANEYANRIVRLQDGEVISDSNPYILVEESKDIKHKRLGNPHMNFFTALSLSFNNLLTKKGRTILTAFAGSIGIIGIALILSLSQGFQNYIDKIQEDTLSSYPLTITSETADATSAILSMVSNREAAKDKPKGTVTEQQYISSMFSAIGTNDLKSFKKYLETNYDKIGKDISSVRYAYSITPLIYTIDATDTLTKINPSSMMSSFYSSSSMSMMSTFGGGSSIFNEMKENTDELHEQYEVLAGRWPNQYNELVLVLSESDKISDLLIYSLGLRDSKELKSMITDLMAGKEVENNEDPMELTYDDLMNIKLKLVNASKIYEFNSKYDVYEDMSDDDEYMHKVYDDAEPLKIVGIVIANDSNSTGLNPGVAYLPELTQYVIDTAKKSAIVQKQLMDPEVDVFSGKSFDEANEEKEDEKKLDFEDMITVDEDMIKEAFSFDIDTDAFDMEDAQAKIPELMQAMIPVLPVAIASANDDFYSSMLNACNRAMTQYLAVEGNTDTTSEPGTTYYVFSPIRIGAFMQTLSCNDIVDELFKKHGLSLTSEQFAPFASNIYMLFNGSAINYINNVYTQIAPDPSIEPPEPPMADRKIVSDAYESSTYLMDYIDSIKGNPDMSKTINEFSIYLANGSIGINIANNAMELITILTEPLTKLSDMFGGEGDNSAFKFDNDKFAKAFKFDMDQDELSRLMESMMSSASEKTKKTNLISLGYQEVDDPTSMSFYFKDFTAKENFLDFLKEYNENVDDEEKEISYTDITGILMSGVKKIVDSVSYVLIAFVSISLVVSSIMIAVITLISVMERTKEIGILRAMGASKSNVSSIFNAETFIIGLLSGLIGVGVTLLSIPPINALIHNLTDNYNINAVLPTKYAVILVIISVVLTMLAGIIPSSKASKQDPVIALRTE